MRKGSYVANMRRQDIPAEKGAVALTTQWGRPPSSWLLVPVTWPDTVLFVWGSPASTRSWSLLGRHPPTLPGHPSGALCLMPHLHDAQVGLNQGQDTQPCRWAALLTGLLSVRPFYMFISHFNPFIDYTVCLKQHAWLLGHWRRC